jgi:hypothetical protein
MRLFLNVAHVHCTNLELSAALDRMERIKGALAKHMTVDDYKTEVRILRESIEDGLSRRFAFYIQTENAERLRSIETEWGKTLKAFTSAADDVVDAVNCLAADNNTACVFHLMRVAEFGLRALARERRVTLPKGRPLEWADWQQILDGIGTKVKAIANKPRGAARERALVFYNGVLAEFGAFKDAYRNNVMHARTSYDEHQARSTMLHVREFMERLAEKIDEHPKRQIKWSAVSP